jgi:hypothetical protein
MFQTVAHTTKQAWKHKRRKGQVSVITKITSHFVIDIHAVVWSRIASAPWYKRANVTYFSFLQRNWSLTKPNKRVLPQLRRLVAGFPRRWPGFKPRSGHVGFVVDKVALRQVSSGYFCFPLPIVIPPTAPHSYNLSVAGTIDQFVTDIPSGLRLTPPQEANRNTQQKLL